MVNIDIAASDGAVMHLGRIILAFIVALSVAMLPAAGSASAVVSPPEMTASAEATASAKTSPAMDECCPDHAKACDDCGNQCQSTASCTVQSVGAVGVFVSGLKYAPLPGNSLAMLRDQVRPLNDGNPPFRPPRV